MLIFGGCYVVQDKKITITLRTWGFAASMNQSFFYAEKMSKLTEYKCNICTEVKTPIELLCVWFGWNKGQSKNTYNFVDNLDSSDKHICTECIKMIKEIKESDFNKLSKTF